MSIAITLPRFVIAKTLKSGTAYYWNPPLYWQRQAAALGRKWLFDRVTLGLDLSQRELDDAARLYNTQFDDWRHGSKDGPVRRYGAYGSVEWLFATYLQSETFKRRVAERSRADYRRLFDAIGRIPTKDNSTFGRLAIETVTPAAAEKVYAKLIAGGRYRQGEKAVMYAKTVWRLMQPHYPREFRTDVPNPWTGVQLVSRVKLRKAAHDRTDVYIFAEKAIALGQPELGAAAVICFEWLQRPENVIAGYVRWPDYAPGRSIRVEHHKTGEMIQHPLVDEDGSPFYPDAEAVLAKLPRRGIPLILRPDGTLYEATRCAQLVRRIADAAELPKTFSLDACRHGGMTELEEAELTDGQGRALSAHKSRAYEGYAKRTAKRVLAATRKRIAHRSSNTKG